MQIPLPRLGDAEDPESLAHGIGDIEIVAGFVTPVPPPPANPLGADLMDHLPGDPLVCECRGIAFQVLGRGHHDSHFKRLGKKMKRRGGMQQMWHSRPRLCSFCCGTAAPGCVPPTGGRSFVGGRKSSSFRSNTAGGGCATMIC